MCLQAARPRPAVTATGRERALALHLAFHWTAPRPPNTPLSAAVKPLRQLHVIVAARSWRASLTVPRDPHFPNDPCSSLR
jgi:hypothetical protein